MIRYLFTVLTAANPITFLPENPFLNFQKLLSEWIIMHYVYVLPEKSILK